MATQFDRISIFGRSPGQIAAHQLRLGMLGALGVFWMVVAVCLWAVFS